MRPSHARTVRTSRKSDERSNARREKRCSTSSASSVLPNRRRRNPTKSCRDSTSARRTAASVGLLALDPSGTSSRRRLSSFGVRVITHQTSCCIRDAFAVRTLQPPRSFSCASGKYCVAKPPSLTQINARKTSIRQGVTAEFREGLKRGAVRIRTHERPLQSGRWRSDLVQECRNGVDRYSCSTGTKIELTTAQY